MNQGEAIQSLFPAALEPLSSVQKKQDGQSMLGALSQAEQAEGDIAGTAGKGEVR